MENISDFLELRHDLMVWAHSIKGKDPDKASRIEKVAEKLRKRKMRWIKLSKIMNKKGGKQ